MQTPLNSCFLARAKYSRCLNIARHPYKADDLFTCIIFGAEIFFLATFFYLSACKFTKTIIILGLARYGLYLKFTFIGKSRIWKYVLLEL